MCNYCAISVFIFVFCLWFSVVLKLCSSQGSVMYKFYSELAVNFRFKSALLPDFYLSAIILIFILLNLPLYLNAIEFI